MKRFTQKMLAFTLIFAIIISTGATELAMTSAGQTDGLPNVVEYVRDVDFSAFTDSDFSGDADTTVVLAEGIKFITSGSSNEKPKIETNTWQSAEGEIYTHRLNTGGGGRWTNAFDGLRRAIIIEDVEIGDKIEIVYGSSSKNRTMSELIGIDGSGNNGPAVLTATATHTPFKYTLTAEQAGTYYYYDPQGTYHIYAVKVTSYTNPGTPDDPDNPDEPDSPVLSGLELNRLPYALYPWLPEELNAFVAFGSVAYDEEENKISLEWYFKETADQYSIYELSDGKTLFAEVDGNNSYEFVTDSGKSEYTFVIEADIGGERIASNQIILSADERGFYNMVYEDGDDDGLADIYELIIDTSLTNPDHDSDSLPDGYEVFTLSTNPLQPDTDNNGISDGSEDFDSDGLTNSQEYSNGTQANNPDSDFDGINDYDEVFTYGTDPLNSDTDGDTLSDSDEITLGLDPLNPETNGYPDSEYTVEQTVDSDSDILAEINDKAGNPFTVSVDMDAAGIVTKNLRTGESGYTDVISNESIVGVIPEFSYPDELPVDEFVLTFKLDDELIDNAIGTNPEDTEFEGIQRYIVFKMFEDYNMLLPIETYYKPESNELYVNTNELGTYCLVDTVLWVDMLNGTADETEAESAKNNGVQAMSMAVNPLSGDSDSDKEINVVFILDDRAYAYDGFSDVLNQINEARAKILEDNENANFYYLYGHDSVLSQSVSADFIAGNGSRSEFIIGDVINASEAYIANKNIPTYFFIAFDNDKAVFRNSGDHMESIDGWAANGNYNISLIANPDNISSFDYGNILIRETQGILVNTSHQSKYADAIYNHVCRGDDSYYVVLPTHYETVTLNKKITKSYEIAFNDKNYYLANSQLFVDSDNDELCDFEEILYYWDVNKTEPTIQWLGNGDMAVAELPTFQMVCDKINDLSAAKTMNPEYSYIRRVNIGSDVRVLPVISNPVNDDSDYDGVSDLEEILAGINPINADTDGDGLNDGIEITEWFDPLNPDPDGDGRLDSREYNEETDPFCYDKSFEEKKADFEFGFLHGDWIPEDEEYSFDVLLGQIARGTVPGYSIWGDISDTVANISRGDGAMQH